jgi:hypothetical protein
MKKALTPGKTPKNDTVSQSNMLLCLIGKRYPQRYAKHFGGKAEPELSPQPIHQNCWMQF